MTEIRRTSSRQLTSAELELRRFCRGEVPLTARLEPWMIGATGSSAPFDLIRRFGSPLNLIDVRPMSWHIETLNEVASQHDVWFRVYFARKANKCLAFVDEAVRAGAGIDTASLPELEQVLSRVGTADDIICTAAIKDADLLKVCVASNVTIAVDNVDELQSLKEIAGSLGRSARVALRVSGFQHEGKKLFSRFGFDVSEVAELVERHLKPSADQRLRVEGLHFHLDGYCPRQRVSAISECLPLIDQLRSAGHPIEFLDIGGGLPMSYIDSDDEWQTFQNSLRDAVAQHRSPTTYRNAGLGYSLVDGKVRGQLATYPFRQEHNARSWLTTVLSERPSNLSQAISEEIASRDLQLRCEPGRSILDGCGMTIARVEFRKRTPNGDWLIGLSMNRTQCRTSSVDFLVDPLLLPNPDTEQAKATEPIAGFPVGAYCTESEILIQRRLHFPHGVGLGDLTIFPNTAGYFMHFLESRSHQFPLARNLVGNGEGDWQLDDIECPRQHPIADAQAQKRG